MQSQSTTTRKTTQPYRPSTLSLCRNCHRSFRLYSSVSLRGKGIFCGRTCYDQWRNSEEHFWERIDRSDAAGCWPWLGPMNVSGYGCLAHHGKTTSSHRVAWILTNGAIPDGVCVLHRCDNRPCCNPSHLFLGTNADNVADKIAKGRAVYTGSPFGSRAGMAKLNEEQVTEIRQLLTTGLSQEKIGLRYGVTQGAIWLIAKGKTWRHSL